MNYYTKILPKYFSNAKEYKRLLETGLNLCNDGCSLTIQNLYGSSKALLVYKLFSDFSKVNKSLVVVTATTQDGENFYQDIKSFSDNNRIFYFPPWEILPYENISPFYDIVHHRIEVLHNLLSSKPVLIVTPIVNLMKVIIPKEVFKKEYLNLKVKDIIDYSNIASILLELGYSKEYKVEQPGSFSLKGSILDIFPSSYEDPIRVELFDDEIESIRAFDAITQLTKKKLDFIEILPQRELILTDKNIDNALSTIKTRFKNYKNLNDVISKIENKDYFQGIEHLIPFFYEPNTLLDYIDEKSIFVFNEDIEIRKKSVSLLKECKTLYNQSHKVNTVRVEPYELFSKYEQVESRVINRVNITQLTRLDKGNNVFNMPISSVDSYIGDINIFRDKLSEKINNEYKVFLFSSYEGQAHRLKSVLADFNPITDSKVNGSGLYLDVAELTEGFSIPEEKVLVIMDREIFGRKRSIYKKLRKISSNPIEGFYELAIGDLIVHINHGIGKYCGIERIKAANRERDCIVLEYADNEKLYIPIEQLNMIQKYIGMQGKKAPLDKLGSKSWEKTKSRVKNSVKEVAKELVDIYSARSKLVGYAFAKDTNWQHDFETGFQYEETPDQLSAIKDIKRDMESKSPTDRLICGDVGYGKTEIAIRATFKAVMDGKQVAVLAPTTILCEQHFSTFTERFDFYPIETEMLSRVKSYNEQKKIVKMIADAEIDVIIGTHRLLSKDINFKNLGLVVIDEEQRFGVRHKERLKSLRTMVDVISLSATPIPRTLYMSLIKIRDMSVINTPPENRLPIDTYTTEFNEDIIKDAIYRELDRNGQVYFIHNRVKTIKGFAQFVKQLVIEAKICVAHGQMDEGELEKVFTDFIHNKYDVMICTTIIESGIDIPNANTILIDRADSLGLSQLYQLRGRVGRSNRKAYCYLFYPTDIALTEVAQKRLAVISEYTDLGSGFKIAMKDMEFRGAGNILGTAQSGNIISVGFELYSKLLDEAILELSDSEKQYESDVFVDLKYSGYIPSSYIPDEKQKIEIYKKMAGAISNEQIMSLKTELIDRFGTSPKIIDNLLTLSYVKVIGKTLKISSIIEQNNEVIVKFNKHSLIKPERLILLMSHYDGLISISPNNTNLLNLKIGDYDLNKKVNFLKKILTELS